MVVVAATGEAALAAVALAGWVAVVGAAVGAMAAEEVVEREVAKEAADWVVLAAAASPAAPTSVTRDKKRAQTR